MKKTSRKKRRRPKKPVGLTRERLHDFYYYMSLKRALEERVQVMYRQNQVVGGIYSSLGQEAISVGAAFALEDGDYCAGMIRNMGVYLIRGYKPRDIMLNWLARANGPTKGKDNSQHFGNPKANGLVSCISMLGTLIPVMAGMAMASQMLNLNRVALTFIGEGGTSVGDFHEGMNFAAVRNLPMVVIIENNQFSYSTPAAVQSKLENFADRALAYGIPGYIGDGNDVLEVYRLTRKAVQEAREGKGPSLIEFKTMRMMGHAVHDSADYVPPGLLEKWKKKDPIRRYRESLLNEGLITETDLHKIDTRVGEEVEDAAEFALQSPMPEPEETYKGVFADDSIVMHKAWWEKE